MQEDISNVHGKNYRNIRIIDLYKATGGASDWLVYGYAFIDKLLFHYSYMACIISMQVLL